jgi:GNAT superfamily N-acetyltransferase
MITNYIGDQEVFGYLRDLVGRLGTCQPLPELWCPLTPSGLRLLEPMLKVVADVAPTLADRVSVTPMIQDNGKELQFFDGAADTFRGKHVFLFDSAVHSGTTMQRAQDLIRGFGAADVCTYALVIKRRTCFIPSMWGVMVNDEDRAFFLLPEIPNNRLTTTRNPHDVYLSARLLTQDDVENLPPVVSGVESLDRPTWGDRFFTMSASSDGQRTYLFQKGGEVLGYLTTHFSGDALVLDEVVTAKAHQKKGVGGVIMRVGDALARHSGCSRVQLNAIEGKVEFYRRAGFEPIAGRKLLILDSTEKYVPMERILLTHLHNRTS